MKIMVGLGNPGKKYQNTRHNTGFLFLDFLAPRVNWHNSKKGKLKYTLINLGVDDYELIKPQTFMNNSGLAVVYVQKKHAILNNSDIFIIHDDLDLALGEFKIQFGKGPKQHNGLNSIENHLKTKDFWRIRIGVKGENYDMVRDASEKSIADDYLLKAFGKNETPRLKEVFTKIKKDILIK